MPQFDQSAAFAFLGGLQVVGLISAWLARFTEESRYQHWYQGLFFLCLLTLGLAMMAALHASPGPSVIMAGTTFAVMVLAATWDFSSGRRTAV